MRWFAQNIPLFVFLFIAFQVVRAIRRAQKLSTQHKADTNETDEQRRVREIQERIRRIAAERRGGRLPPASSVSRPTEPLQRSILTPPPLDPFSGPTRSAPGRFERHLVRPEPSREVETTRADLQRRQQVADEVRALTEQRAFAQRQAERIVATAKEEASSERAARENARAALLDDLRDPQSLRRAFLLREVLGAPVGLR